MIQRGQLHQSSHSLHRVLCQQYSNYTCILSNAPAIFCRYIIVRKYEPLFINRTVGASCQNFRVLHSAYALIQYADNAYCYTSLRIRFIVLCQQYSDYTCILSNAPAIFCRYIIVRKYEPLFINRTVAASCQNFRVLHRGSALIQRGQLHQSPHSLHRVLCQQYSNYTCIISNAPAIFCRYIIVRKYEPLFINRTVGASCQNFRVLQSRVVSAS